MMVPLLGLPGQATTSVVKRAGINRSFTGSTGRPGMSQASSATDLGDKADSETAGLEIAQCVIYLNTTLDHPHLTSHAVQAA